MSDFYYHTTSTSGNDRDMPTPIELSLEQDETGFTLSVKGTNGDQVTDAVSTILKTMPLGKNAGLANFLSGLALITAVFLLITVYTVSSAPKIISNPTTGGLVK